ncbi:MAG: 2Fe-2S iron-sulfur cluster-binding protein [Chloroflexota bacterium]
MSEKMITLTIDGEDVTVPEGTTLLDAAEMVGKEIPIICYSDKTTANGLCRLCVVDVNEGRVLQPACIATCQHESNVETRNERVKRSRRTILEMLDASVNLDEAQEIQQYMGEYNASGDRFPDAEKRESPIMDDNPFYVRDYSQCVTCWRCVQVCAEDAQYTFALILDGRGHDTSVATTFGVGMTESPCVFCGQCIDVCPTGALKPKVEWGMEQGMAPDEIRQMTRKPRKQKQNGSNGRKD